MKEHKIATGGFARAKDTPRRRPKRIAEILREEIANVLLTKFRDPRIDGQFVTITEIDVSPDIKNAKVYYCTMKAETDINVLKEVMSHAAPFFRSELAHRLEGGYGVPTLHFIYDEIIEGGMKIESLIDEALKKVAKE